MMSRRRGAGSTRTPVLKRARPAALRAKDRTRSETVIRADMTPAGMAESGTILDVDNAVQASILLFAAEGGRPVMGATKMRMMVFYLLKHAGSIAGKGLGGTDAHVNYDSGDVDAELRRLLDAGAVRRDSMAIEATAAGRDAAGALRGQLDEFATDILRNTKEFYGDLTDAELLAYNRAAYPDAGGRGALEKGELKMVEGILLGLIDKGKISTGRAAELLHRSREDVMRMASAAGIPVLN